MQIFTRNLCQTCRYKFLIVFQNLIIKNTNIWIRVYEKFIFDILYQFSFKKDIFIEIRFTYIFNSCIGQITRCYVLCYTIFKDYTNVMVINCCKLSLPFSGNNNWYENVRDYLSRMFQHMLMRSKIISQSNLQILESVLLSIYGGSAENTYFPFVNISIHWLGRT